MRLLHITPTYIPAYRYGGPIHSVHSLCRNLADIGHDVHVLTTSVDGPFDSDVPHDRPVNLDGVLVHYARARYLRRLYWSPELAAYCRATISGFDAVHLHSVFLYPTWQGSRCATSARVPYVLSPRGMLDRRLIKARSSFIKRTWINLVERDNLSGASAIHLTSQEEWRALADLGLARAPTAIIPNGVDVPLPLDESAISPDVRAAVATGFQILAFGRINWKKALDRLLHALAQMPEARLVIAGNDEDGEAAKLQVIAESCGVAKRVRFVVRHLTGADREALFASAQVLALPSLSENFGNVVAEAMIRGLPVVVTAQVGAAEIVAASGAGEIADGNPEALATALLRILNCDKLRHRMATAGVEYARVHLSWNSIAQRFAELYGSIAEAGRKMRSRNSH
ncbi:glycosyltransferase [Rhodoplanes sp. Z2-YC6860]|uniref:glycosyltransferase n=1 Tax=Rhodoplanes sp. Z2-YC6860 TaxID=674703 RepID=UPI00078C68C1|nr:glycosyltransferase [Rhodoplanes sp. Z2-YC6860]AMN43746.1 group 1 glycosyl transferase [Rhodoplanes sp. Z2-YC6860]